MVQLTPLIENVNVNNLPRDVHVVHRNKDVNFIYDTLQSLDRPNFLGLDLGVGNESGGVGTIEVDGETYELLSSEKSGILNSVPFSHLKILSQGATSNKWYIAIHGINYNTLLRLTKKKNGSENLWG